MTKKAQSKAKKAPSKQSVAPKPLAKAKADPKAAAKQVLKASAVKDLEAGAKKLVKSKASLPAEMMETAPAASGAKAAKPAKAAKGAAKVASKPTRAHRGEVLCRETNCENLPTSGGYCRLHYIKNWKKIKKRELILKEGKLNRYIEELVNKYPDKYIEAIRQDLSSEDDFAKTIADLELDESSLDYDAESPEGVEGLIPEIRTDVDDEGEF